MATWTDGAAYAPIERPDGFATPEAAPLEVAEPRIAATAGPIPPPATFQPSAPQPPLEQIHSTPVARRDPAEPFRTATAALTAGPQVPGTARDPLEPFTTYTSVVGSQELPPPIGDPLPPPVGAPLPVAPDSALPPPTGAPLPAPGQPPVGAPVAAPPPGQAPAWGPPPSQAPDRSSATTFIVVMIVLNGLAVLLPGAAAWLVLVSGLLGLRTRPFTGQLGVSAVSTGVALLLLAIVDVGTAGLSLIAALVFLGWSVYGLRAVRK